VLANLRLCFTGRNHATVKRHIEQLGLSIAHFLTPAQRNRLSGSKKRKPLSELLVKGEHRPTSKLKKRLYEEGLKQAACEECGQTEIWRGRHMSLILDHINGDTRDNRLENLRILCPNCNATLETHCGKNMRNIKRSICAVCSGTYKGENRYCSQTCRQKARRAPRPDRRKVERPPQAIIRKEVSILGFSATGRKYGVSDNAIRKWLNAAE
jgi:hypothetical protein